MVSGDGLLANKIHLPPHLQYCCSCSQQLWSDMFLEGPCESYEAPRLAQLVGSIRSTIFASAVLLLSMRNTDQTGVPELLCDPVMFW